GSNNGWYLEQYREAVAGIQRRLVARSKPNGWVYVGEIPSRGSFSPKQDHLACFLPGLLALGTLHGADNGRALSEESETEADGSGGGGGIESHLGLAKALMQTCYKMYEVTETGLSPEIVYFNDGKLGNARDYKIEAAFLLSLTLLAIRPWPLHLPLVACIPLLPQQPRRSQHPTAGDGGEPLLSPLHHWRPDVSRNGVEHFPGHRTPRPRSHRRVRRYLRRQRPRKQPTSGQDGVVLPV
ncbi:unnamed protein product, partial [Phaeothamnion confervicola]